MCSTPKISDVPSSLPPLLGGIELFNLRAETKFSALYSNEKNNITSPLLIAFGNFFRSKIEDVQGGEFKSAVSLLVL